MHPVDVEAVTIDAFGTLVDLVAPAPALQAALAARGVERTEDEVRRAFRVEAAYYRTRSHEGRDAETLAVLRRDCTAVFLGAAEAPLDVDEFIQAFVDALGFVEVAGAGDACRLLKDAGLRLAVVSNWDVGLHEHLRALGLHDLVDVVLTSAEAGAPKPAPQVFALAVERLGAMPERTVHVGDSAADADGARAAGLRFEPAPLLDAARRIIA
jgi:HAD superfamily hydrolase (TIGR01509 family)